MPRTSPPLLMPSDALDLYRRYAEDGKLDRGELLELFDHFAAQADEIARLRAKLEGLNTCSAV